MKTCSISKAYSTARRGGGMRLNHEVCKAHLNEVPTDFAGKTVLDVACGHENPFFCRAASPGEICYWIGWRPAGDIKKRCDSPEGHVGDIHAMPLASGSVDVVVSVDTIEHSVEPDLFLKECHRVLRAAGGEAVFATPNLLGYKNAFARFSGKRVFDFVWRAST